MSQRFYLRKWRSLAVLMIVITAIIGAGHYLSSPVSGRQEAVTEQLIKPHTSNSQTVSAAPGTLHTTYFNLSLPAGYRQQSTTSQPPGELYAGSLLHATQGGTLIIGIGLKSLSGSSLAADSSYALRVAHPAQYQQTTQTIASDQIIVFSDLQSVSAVAFWVHGNYLATLSVSAADQDISSADQAMAIQALQPLLKAWQWQN